MIKKGFTLIELMVVIFIVALLASLVVVNVNNSRIKSRDAKRISDMGTVSSALAAYYADNHYYPTVGNNGLSNPNYGTITAALNTGGYLTSVPQDPRDTGSNVYSYRKCPAGCTNGAAVFCSSYVLCSYLENPQNNPLGSNNNFTVIGGENSTSTSCP